LSILNFDENKSLFGVFDGHGGPEVALCAAEKIPELIKNDFYRDGDYGEALKKAFMDFDEYLLTMDGYTRMKALHGYPVKNNSKSDGTNDKFSSKTSFGYASGTTAVVALSVNDWENTKMYVAHVGDSGCIISDHLVQCTYMTKDHNPKYEPELSRILAAGGIVANGRVNHDLNMSRALGDHLYKGNSLLSMTEQIIIGMPEVKVKEIKPEFGRFMLIACDGIWNSITRNKAAIIVSEFIKSPTVKMSEICQHLILRCLAPSKAACGGRGLDNMTCILIRFKDAPEDVCAGAMNSLKLK